MAHHNSLVQLNTLLEEVLLWLQILILTCLCHMVIEQGVVRNWRHNTREQITCDTVVKRDIVLSELWKIDVVQRTKTKLIFWPV